MSAASGPGLGFFGEISNHTTTDRRCTTMPTTSASTPRSGWFRRTFLFLVAALATVILGTGCSSNPSLAGALAQDKQTLATCDPAHAPASWVAIDGTGSSASDQIAAERMTAVESIVRKTAICSGQLRVLAFSASSAATATLFEGQLHLDGATANSRLKRVPGVVDNVMTKIRSAYGPSVAGLDGSGSDITAQYRLAGEWINQLGGRARLHLYLLTDGFQNIGVDLDARALSKVEATALANQVNVPKLPGASVVVAGLGKVASAPPRSDVVEGLVAYYDALCKKTDAAQCVSVTDFAPEGW
jgi:hypothetical protein